MYTYIAGDIVFKIDKIIYCDICKQLLYNNVFKITSLKNCGKLINASADVIITLCKTA